MTDRILIQNKHGIHIRAAARLVRVASSFAAPIQVKCHGRAVSAKSLLGLLELAIPQGAELEIEAQGDQAAPALEAIHHLAETRFGEPE